MGKIKLIGDFFTFKGLNHLKVYMVFKIKKIATLKELEFTMNIEKEAVKEAVKILEKEGAIISKDYYNVDNLTQRLIKTTSASYLKKVQSDMKIYSLIEPEPFNYLEVFRDEFLNVCEDESFKFTLNLIKEKTISYQKIKEEYLKKNQRNFIYETTEDGILFYHESDTYKEFKKNIQLTTQNMKQLSNNQDVNDKNTQLSKIESILSLETIEKLPNQNKENENFLEVQNKEEKKQKEIKEYEKKDKIIESSKTIFKDEDEIRSKNQNLGNKTIKEILTEDNKSSYALKILGISK